MTNIEKIVTRAKDRKKSIESSALALEGIKQVSKDSSLLKRIEVKLKEYTLSLKLLNFTIDTGRVVKYEGESTADGVTMRPATGSFLPKGGAPKTGGQI